MSRSACFRTSGVEDFGINPIAPSSMAARTEAISGASSRKDIETMFQLVYLRFIGTHAEYDKIDAVRGLNISITTSAKTDEEAKALLSAFSFPFRN